METPDFGNPHFINVQGDYICIKKIKRISQIKRGGNGYSFIIEEIDGNERYFGRSAKQDYVILKNGEYFGYLSESVRQSVNSNIPDYEVEEFIDRNKPKIEINEVEVDNPLHVTDHITEYFDCTKTYNKVKALREQIAEYVNESQHQYIPKFDFED